MMTGKFHPKPVPIPHTMRPTHAFLSAALLALLPASIQAAKTETFTLAPIPPSTIGGNVIAIVPDAYDGSTAFPSLLLLHGAGDDEKAWPQKAGDVGTVADKFHRIILCPSAGPLSWYNPHNGSEPYVMENVLPAAAKRYKLSDDHWIAGNSMGGYGSLRLFADYPKVFTAVIAFSPGTKPSRWVKNWGISAAFGPGLTTGDEDTFTDAWLKRLANNTRPIVMVCGDKDFFLKDFNECLAAADKAGVKVITYPTQGGHDWGYWTRELPRALDKVPVAVKR